MEGTKSWVQHRVSNPGTHICLMELMYHQNNRKTKMLRKKKDLTARWLGNGQNHTGWKSINCKNKSVVNQIKDLNQKQRIMTFKKTRTRGTRMYISVIVDSSWHEMNKCCFPLYIPPSVFLLLLSLWNFVFLFTTAIFGIH